MGKKIVKILFFILIIFGIASGIYISINKNNVKKQDIQKVDNVFGNLQSKSATVTKFFTYGDTLNVTGSLSNISKDNFENAKIVLTDGENEIVCNLETNIEEKNLNFTTSEINNAIELDKLSIGNYYVLLRVKLNNSANAKYYTLSNESECEDIEYYTVTRNSENNKINIQFLSKEYQEKEYEYLGVNVSKAENTDEIYDFVIDAGHGGQDSGEKLNGHTEANITLDYAKDLKVKLEDIGLKVKLTRDDENSSSYTYTNMYDEDGRISIACKSKAKYMISFHVNNGNNNLSGLEIYAPPKSDLKFAELMADKINASGANTYSNNTGFKKSDGVYVWTFTKSMIKDFEATANKKGYQPYNITTDTPYQYTIREVGGISTNAYADGRNTTYSPNEYYDSNQGIECYQVELGYIKNDLDKILYNREAYITSIVQAVQEYLGL